MQEEKKRLHLNNLKNLYKNLCANYNLKQLCCDKERCEDFAINIDGFMYDYSKQFLDSNILNELISFAESLNLKDKIHDMLSGREVNYTEKCAALHPALRSNSPNMGKDKDNIYYERKRFLDFTDRLRAGEIKTSDDENVTDIVYIGIGGSSLGPKLCCDALKHLKNTKLKIHFVSNVDDSFYSILSALKPNKTIFIVSSKSFTTKETLTNANIAISWLNNFYSSSEQSKKQLYAITSSISKATEFGISDDNIFVTPSQVGGRFSLWSAVGMPLAIQCGSKVFMELLQGANFVDEHFRSSDVKNNIPIIMALISFWNVNILNTHTHAILPYHSNLELMIPYLQQLEMESNGKSTTRDTYLQIDSSPIIWGGVGTDVQHTFMQQLHQGTIKSCVDFILIAKSHQGLSNNMLLANASAQALALAEGNEDATLHRQCSGGVPSSAFWLSELNAFNLGRLLACYEHKVYAFSCLLGINCFDQFGVELGKNIANQLTAAFDGDDSKVKDFTIANWIKFYQQYK